ncbi:MAG TPA: RNB domain-containing ribonuclease [Opitutaceae bacterium]|nr:RNB domain-containing ribonuclease [Opitutaceae bacterium]
MTDLNGREQRVVLRDIAWRVMAERGLIPDFSRTAVTELAALHAGDAVPEPGTRDLRSLAWCSIDNDDSRDLDQLSVGEALPDGAVRLCVAIADVASLVKKGSALDAHARQNTTSVYTAGEIFPMLPEKLSTDLTSLNPGVDRLAIVVDMVFSAAGDLQRSDVYPAQVHNRAKLAYPSVAAWLDGTGPMPAPIGAAPGLDENLRLQDRMAQVLRDRRQENGALSLETIQTNPVYAGQVLKDLVADHPNRAKNLIEDLMVAANGVVARYFAAKKVPSLRRVVRTPEHWDRIVELAAARGTTLPDAPDAPALEKFLCAQRKADPLRFPDLSLSVIKLLGAGEYVLERPGGASAGHFGLAVRDYTHSTAPNRRYPDLISQRMLKAVLAGRALPYTTEELESLALHCTEQEDAAKKVERQVAKSAAALLLLGRIGDRFDALVTGASDKGTWVRLLRPPVEGRLVSGGEGRKVGQTLKVQLLSVDVQRGYIDLRAA